MTKNWTSYNRYTATAWEGSYHSYREGNTNIHPVPVARNLDSWLDASLSMTEHISKICSSSFYYLNNVGSGSISPISQQSHLFMLSYQFVLTKVTVYCMVCQNAHWSNYNVCRMPVLDWYLLRVDCHITRSLLSCIGYRFTLELYSRFLC